MNVIDGLLLLILIGALAAGFFQGMIRMIILLVVFYLSTVLASLYFPMVATFFQRRFGSERVAAEYIAFAVVHLVSFILLTAAGLYTFRYAKLPGQLQYIDRIVGVFLGLLMGALGIGIFSVLLWDIMIVAGGRNIEWPFMRMLGRAVQTSFLLRYFANVILPDIYAYFDPILPEAANRIFIIRQN